MPLLVCIVDGVVSGSPGFLLWGFLVGLVGAVVGVVTGGIIGLRAGVLFELRSLVPAPALVVALGMVAPVFLGLYVLSGVSGVSDHVVGEGSGTAAAVLAAGPLAADVIQRTGRLEVERAAISPHHAAASCRNWTAR